MPFCLWTLSYPPKQLLWFPSLDICELISVIWILISRVSSGSHFRTLRCSVMFRHSQLCNVHDGEIDLCCWPGKIYAINVWRVTSQTPHPNQSIIVTRCFILHN